MTHTPGPWTGHKFYGQQQNSVLADCGLRIAMLQRSAASARSVECRAEGEANARLIAAAPDLLDALEAILRECCLVHRHWAKDRIRPKQTRRKQRPAQH